MCKCTKLNLKPRLSEKAKKNKTYKLYTHIILIVVSHFFYRFLYLTEEEFYQNVKTRCESTEFLQDIYSYMIMISIITHLLTCCYFGHFEKSVNKGKHVTKIFFQVRLNEVLELCKK